MVVIRNVFRLKFGKAREAVATVQGRHRHPKAGGAGGT